MGVFGGPFASIASRSAKVGNAPCDRFASLPSRPYGKDGSRALPVFGGGGGSFRTAFSIGGGTRSNDIVPATFPSGPRGGFFIGGGGSFLGTGDGVDLSGGGAFFHGFGSGVPLAAIDASAFAAIDPGGGGTYSVTGAQGSGGGIGGLGPHGRFGPVLSFGVHGFGDGV